MRRAETFGILFLLGLVDMKMGKEKYLRDVERLFEKSPVVGFASIERVIGKRGGYAKQLVRNLVLKGKIKKLAKGCYTRHDENSLAVFCFKGYLGLQDALSFHNLWEQETIPVIITGKKVRQGIRDILGGNVLIRRIDKKYLFGFDYFREGEFHFPYSDIEKTFIDMIYFNENLSEEVLVEMRKKIDRKKLEGYLRKYHKRFRGRILSVLV